MATIQQDMERLQEGVADCRTQLIAIRTKRGEGEATAATCFEEQLAVRLLAWAPSSRRRTKCT